MTAGRGLDGIAPGGAHDGTPAPLPLTGFDDAELGAGAALGAGDPAARDVFSFSAAAGLAFPLGEPDGFALGSSVAIVSPMRTLSPSFFSRLITPAPGD